jgi:transposase InsO family protein
MPQARWQCLNFPGTGHLILNRAHLRAVLAEYQEHYNTARPHQGIGQCIPDGDPCPRVTAADPARGRSTENRYLAA